MRAMRKFLGRPWWGGERLGDFLLALGIALVGVLVCWVVAAYSAPATIGIPNTFATQSGNVPASQLDTNFTTVAGQPGVYRVVDLFGQNDTVSPTTKYGLNANAVVVLNNTTGQTAIFTNVPTTTCDVTLAGPTANGRDQAGAFGANTWLHFYYIWKSPNALPDCIVSASTPPTGPTLPAGYTHWAYGTAISFSSSNLVKARARGSWVHYENNRVALVSGQSTSEKAINLASFIPPNALAFNSQGRFLVTSDAGGIASVTAQIGVVSGVVYEQWTGQMTAAIGALQIWPWGSTTFPNLGSNLSYTMINSNGTGGGLDLNVTGYQLPNGGE